MSNLLNKLKQKGVVDIESPFIITIENVTYTYQCLIKGYGPENGMIIDSNFKKIEPIQSELIKMGYGFSCFDILDSSSSDAAEEFINEVLIGDWGENNL